MKEETKKRTYVKPELQEYHVQPFNVIATSDPLGDSTELYGDGSTDGWF